MVFCSLIRDVLEKQLKYISKFGHEGRTKEKEGGKKGDQGHIVLYRQHGRGSGSPFNQDALEAFLNR